MSLNITLVASEPVTRYSTGVFVRRDGKTVELSYDEAVRLYGPGRVQLREVTTNAVWRGNITGNVVPMAKRVGAYDWMWIDGGPIRARIAIPALTKCYLDALDNEAELRKLEPANGWGNYDSFVGFLRDYLMACIEYPDAEIYTSAVGAWTTSKKGGSDVQ